MASAFDPAAHLRTLEDGSEYLDARWRLVWFLRRHRKYSITSTLVHLSSRLAVVKVAVTVPGGRTAEGLGMAAPHDVYRYVETAQTHALARALAMLGFGTEAALDFDTEARADSGVRRDGHKQEDPEGVAGHDAEEPADQVDQPQPEPRQASQPPKELPSWANLERPGTEHDSSGTPDAPSNGNPSGGRVATESPLSCQECQGPVKEGRTRQGKVLSPHEVAEKSRQQTGKVLCPRCLTRHMARASTEERKQQT